MSEIGTEVLVVLEGEASPAQLVTAKRTRLIPVSFIKESGWCLRLGAPN